MKYYSGIELICIRTLTQKKGLKKGQVNFIKGKTYKVEEIFQKEYAPDKFIHYIKLINEQGELQTIVGQNKTKYLKIPHPEGVPVIPPSPPKSTTEKAAAYKVKKDAKKLEQEHQKNEWKKLKKFKVRDRNKRIITKEV